ncbi:MAG TPA: NUDIX domain-containing protein [Candidatus Saccharimonadales bacterium]|nr:NUDIX domain-containing protein [Candidatus Saccharimonadales bacterium]
MTSFAPLAGIIKVMAIRSAGILLYRLASKGYEVLLVHPGGPFWARKDLGSWSIPKGEFDESEQPLAAAKREFQEEVGFDAPEGNYRELGEAKQPSGKLVYGFALEAKVDINQFKSNLFEMEWPPKSGKRQKFPENDEVAWVPLPVALEKVVKGQRPFIEKLAAELGQSLNSIDSHDTPQVSLF